MLEFHPDSVAVRGAHFLDGAFVAGDEQGGVLVDFTVDFAFKNRMFEMLAGQVFDKALRKMIGAFEGRAAELYGSASPDASSATGGGNSSSSAHLAA